MCVRFRHFPEFGVTLNIYSGTLTSEVIMRFLDRLEPTPWTRWINYLDPTADFSSLDIAHIPVIRRAFADTLKRLYGEARLQVCWVSASPMNESILRFWPSYIGIDVQHPIDPASFPTIARACAWLELPVQPFEELCDYAGSVSAGS